MPGKLVDMQIAYTADSAKLAHDIYSSLPTILKRRIEYYDELLRKASRDRSEYLKQTKEAPTAIRDRRDDAQRYIEEVHGLGYDDFCEVNNKLFGNKEFRPKPDNVRGRDVFFISAFKGYSSEDDPNAGYMQIFMTMDALKRASARGRILVAPYMPYQRQDRKDESRVPISFKAIADLLETVGTTRLLTMDMHAPQEQGFFDFPVDDLTPINHFKEVIDDIRKKHEVVLINPDAGSAKRNEYLMKLLGLKQVIIDKGREENGTELRDIQNTEALPGAVAVLVDDLIGTGGTNITTARRVKTYNPLQIVSLSTHLIGNPRYYMDLESGIINDPQQGLKDLQECQEIDRVIVTDSNFSASWSNYSKIEVLSVGELFGNAIFETQTDGSVSRLFPKIPVK